MLDYTPKELVQRDVLVVNPAKICQPIGATYAAMGIHNCMPHSHGSQGCLSYLRMCLTRHFREPTVGTTSSFYEGTAVFGGAANLKQALTNIEAVYTPEVVAIHTTCLSETIGDDVNQIIDDVREEGLIDPSIKLCAASTPSYVGSHVTGYDNMVKSFVTTFAKKTKPNGKLNLIPGFVDPGDIRAIKRILSIMKIPTIVFPDQTDVFDTGLAGERELFARGGTPIGDVEDSANSMGTIALCSMAGGAAANVFKNKFKMPVQIGPAPIGIRFTDRFVMKAAELANVPIPPELEQERARVVDMMTDAHPHFYGKKVAIFGDPDILEGLTSLVLEMGMEPTVVLSGSVSKDFENRVSGMVHPLYPKSQILTGADLFTLHQLIKNEPVDMLIGNTYGKHIALAEDIPLIRVGFPIMDRANLHHFPVMGYTGAARMVEWIGNTFLDIKDKTVPEEELEVVQ
jgi:nitrogenase molybdenum-iron protein beta chain